MVSSVWGVLRNQVHPKKLVFSNDFSCNNGLWMTFTAENSRNWYQKWCLQILRSFWSIYLSTTLLATMTLTGQYSTSNQLGHRTAHHDSHQPVEIPSMFLAGCFSHTQKKWGFCATSAPNRVFFGGPLPNGRPIFHGGHKWGGDPNYQKHPLKKNILQVTFPPIFNTPFPIIMGNLREILTTHSY